MWRGEGGEKSQGDSSYAGHARENKQPRDIHNKVEDEYFLIIIVGFIHSDGPPWLIGTWPWVAADSSGLGPRTQLRLGTGDDQGLENMATENTTMDERPGPGRPRRGTTWTMGPGC